MSNDRIIADIIPSILCQSSIRTGLLYTMNVFVLQTIPQQYLLEVKFLSGQPIYRFRLDTEGDFTINFQQGTMTSLKNESRWEMRRRPLFVPPPLVQPYVNYVLSIVYCCIFCQVFPYHFCLNKYTSSLIG